MITPTVNKIQQGRRGCRTCARARAASARRFSDDLAVPLMRAAGAEPLEPYPGSHARWRSRCLTCHREVRPSLSSARTQGPCVYCGGNKVDQSVVHAAMERAGLRPLGEFPGSDVPWPCQCMGCQRTITPRYSSIKAGQSGCKYCARRAVDPDDAAAIMHAAGLQPLEVYPGSKIPWPCIAPSAATWSTRRTTPWPRVHGVAAPGAARPGVAWRGAFPRPR
jgi:hypothetical protein